MGKKVVEEAAVNDGIPMTRKVWSGMEAHVGTDSGTGLAYSIVVTDAGVHDSQVMDELLHGEEKAVYGDRAYNSEEKRKEYEAKGIKWCVNRKACRHYQLTPEDLEYNHKQSQIRVKGEHAFFTRSYLMVLI